MTHTAASTLLKRLQEKGLVSRRKGSSGKAFVFRAKVLPTRTYRRTVSNLVNRLFAGNSLAMVSALYETQPPTPEDLDQLQELVDEQVVERPGDDQESGYVETKESQPASCHIHFPGPQPGAVLVNGTRMKKKPVGKIRL